MEPAFRFHEVHVVSDLHMGGEGKPRQIFRQGALLARLIDELGSGSSRRDIALVVNGDMVDFLAEPQAVYFDPEGAIGKLERMFGDPSFQPVWQALQRFVARAHRTLVINLGNHDLELALPWVRRRLLEELSLGDDRRRGRIELAFDGTGFLCAVGDARVLCVHGNEVDSWNVTDYEALRRQGLDPHLGREVKAWTPNAGTKLVIEVMNRIKGSYPFVDLLKPEAKAVVPTLFALDHDLRPYLDDALAVAARLSLDKVRRRMGWLSADEEENVEPDEDAPAATGRLIAELARASFSSARTGEDERAAVNDLLHEIEPRLEAGDDPMNFVSFDESGEQLGAFKAAWDWVRGKKPEQVLREALKGLQKDRSFSVGTVDDTYRELDKLATPVVDFLVAGHTHLERALRRSSGYYFNSGTWARLIELKPDTLDSDSRFKPVWKALREGSMAALDKARPKLVQDKPAVVSIVADGSLVRGTLRRVKPAGDGVTLAPVDGTDAFERS